MMRNFDLDDIHASNMLTCSQTLKIAGFLTSAAIVCLGLSLFLDDGRVAYQQKQEHR